MELMLSLVGAEIILTLIPIALAAIVAVYYVLKIKWISHKEKKEKGRELKKKDE